MNLSLTSWIGIGALAVILALGAALKVESGRLDTSKQAFAAFQAETKALGEVAETKARAQEAADKQRKVIADEHHDALLAANVALAGKLRDARAGRGYLPGAPAGARSADAACFDRGKLEQSIRQLDAGVSGLIGESDQAVIDLNAAKGWAAQPEGLVRANRP